MTEKYLCQVLNQLMKKWSGEHLVFRVSCVGLSTECLQEKVSSGSDVKVQQGEHWESPFAVFPVGYLSGSDVFMSQLDCDGFKVLAEFECTHGLSSLRLFVNPESLSTADDKSYAVVSKTKIQSCFEVVSLNRILDWATRLYGSDRVEVCLEGEDFS